MRVENICVKWQVDIVGKPCYNDGMNSSEVKDLVISGENRQLLNTRVYDLVEVLREIVKMEQITDISLAAGTRNNVFVFKYQEVNINVEGVV